MLADVLELGVDRGCIEELGVGGSAARGSEVADRASQLLHGLDRDLGASCLIEIVLKRKVEVLKCFDCCHPFEEVICRIRGLTVG